MVDGPLDNDADLPDPTNPAEVIEALEPETVDGPLGIPIVKPRGAPDLPDGADVDLSDLEDSIY